MIWDRVRAHQDAVAQFQRSIGRGRLSHGYLFIGPSGIGKRLFARTMAQCLLCANIPDEQLDACGKCGPCKQMAAGTHPDFIEIGCPEGKKDLPIELIAGSLGKRGKEGLCHELSLRPMEGDRKIAIIDDADMMNAASANAFLKTLEEPPPYATLFLIAASADGLLPTILSRCQQVRFAPLPPDVTAELLIKLEMVKDDAEAVEIAQLCEGSLTTAAQLLDPGLRVLRDQLYNELARGTSMNPVRLADQMAEGIDGLGSQTADQRRNARWLLRFVIEFYRQTSLMISGAQSAPIKQVEQYCQRLTGDAEDSLDMVAGLFNRCEKAQYHLDQFMQIPLCLEGLFEELARISRNAVSRV